MKKIFIAVLLLSAVLTLNASVFADTSCMCLGIGSSGSCGSGALGGSFPKKYPINESKIKQYLASVKALGNFSNLGKAYDGATGWFCWKGNL